MTEQMKNRKHWLVLWMCCGLSVIAVGLTINTAGVFYTPVSESINVLRGTFAFQSTISLVATAIVSLFFPRLVKKYRFQSLIRLGVVVTALSTALLAFSSTMPHFYLLGAIRGAAIGLFGTVPVTMVINEWFEKHHGMATSVALAGAGFGGAVFSPIFSRLIESMGWNNAYLVLAGVIVVFCLPALLFPFAANPQEEGLLPYGYGAGKVKTEPVTEVSQGKSKINVVHLITFLIFTLLSMFITGIPHHFPGFAETLQYSATVGAAMLSAGMIADVASKLVMGMLSDWLGAFRATMMMVLLNVLAIVILLMGTSTVTMVIGAFLFGSIFAIGSVAKTLLTRDFFGLEGYRKVFPVISFVGTFSGAFALSLIGYIYDFTGSYLPAYFLAIAFQIVNIVLLLILKQQTKQQEGSEQKNKSLHAYDYQHHQ